MTALKSFGQSWNSVRPLFRVDRIPILSFLFGRREFWTELELCPPVSPAGADIYPCLARKSKKNIPNMKYIFRIT